MDAAPQLTTSAPGDSAWPFIASRLRSKPCRLFLISFLAVLSAVILVRLEGSQVAVLGYMPYAIVASFLFGISLGLARPADQEGPAGGRLAIRCQFAVSCLSAVARHTAFGQLGLVPDASTYFPHLVFWGWSLGQEVVTAFILIPLFSLNMLLGRALAADYKQALAATPAVIGYRITLAGCASAVVINAALLAWSAPPLAFIVLLLALFLALRLDVRGAWPWWAGFAAAVVALSLPPHLNMSFSGAGVPFEIWGPYQQLQSRAFVEEGELLGFELTANGVHSQTAADLKMSTDELSSLKRRYQELDLTSADLAFYRVPFAVVEKPKRILVIGSGTGNDVAACVANGAQQIDAVEIDPAVAHLGTHHPQRPYAQAGVRLYVEDGRAFLERTSAVYDLILVARADALVAGSVLSPSRQSDFVYTTEALEAMRSHLAPGGCLALAFKAPRKWCFMRLVANLRQVFAKVDGACVLTPGFYLFASHEGRPDLNLRLASLEGVVSVPDISLLNDAPVDIDRTTDEWPFLFAQTRSLPIPYLWCLYLLIVVYALAVRRHVALWLARLPDKNSSREDNDCLGSLLNGCVLSLIAAWSYLALAPALGSTLALTAGVIVVSIFAAWLGAQVKTRWERMFLPFAGPAACVAIVLTLALLPAALTAQTLTLASFPWWVVVLLAAPAACVGTLTAALLARAEVNGQVAPSGADDRPFAGKAGDGNKAAGWQPLGAPVASYLSCHAAGLASGLILANFSLMIGSKGLAAAALALFVLSLWSKRFAESDNASYGAGPGSG